jgi:hypothetical protein
MPRSDLARILKIGSRPKPKPKTEPKLEPKPLPVPRPDVSELLRRVEQLEATIAEIGEAAAETLTEVDG